MFRKLERFPSLSPSKFCTIIQRFSVLTCPLSTSRQTDGPVCGCHSIGDTSCELAAQPWILSYPSIGPGYWGKGLRVSSLSGARDRLLNKEGSKVEQYVAMCPLLSLFCREENRDGVGDACLPFALHSQRSTDTPFIGENLRNADTWQPDLRFLVP